MFVGRGRDSGAVESHSVLKSGGGGCRAGMGRGGLLYGLLRGMDWETTGCVASLMGAIKIERVGPQNHRIDIDQFRDRFKQEFHRTLD